MNNEKRYLKRFFIVFIIFLFSLKVNTAFAIDYNSDVEQDRIIFEIIFDDCINRKVETIQNDEDAYAFLIQNTNLMEMEINGTIKVDINVIENEKKFNKDDILIIEDFVRRINNLVTLQAISIDSNLKIDFVSDISIKSQLRPMMAIIDIMGETRLHSDELRQVYDSAIFSQKHYIAGKYFAERVKSGGIWDYKSYLGTNTLYYVEDLNKNMTGEAIGNFHYGYVGRTVFSELTLKSAAGMYQIYSGTSGTKYWDSFFDDPNDQYDIQLGINKYNLEH